MLKSMSYSQLNGGYIGTVISPCTEENSYKKLVHEIVWTFDFLKILNYIYIF